MLKLINVNWYDSLVIKFHLNTSHVKVNPFFIKKIWTSEIYLNTSHVKVNPNKTTVADEELIVFKYISC